MKTNRSIPQVLYAGRPGFLPAHPSHQSPKSDSRQTGRSLTHFPTPHNIALIYVKTSIKKEKRKI